MFVRCHPDVIIECAASKLCSSVVPDRGQPTMKIRSGWSCSGTGASDELAISLVAQLAEQPTRADAEQEFQGRAQLDGTRAHAARIDGPDVTSSLAALHSASIL